MPASNHKQRAYLESEQEAALEAFVHRYGTDIRFAPVLVVIAAFNEAESIAEVLHAVPSSVCGLPVDVLVIDDGSADQTSGVVERYSDRVRLARLERNCGHGVALRLGYRLAAEHGADYVVTLDADLQWHPREMPVVLPPLLAGKADLVIGSRVLGGAETDDWLRHAGVRVFAVLVSLLTGLKITDTSSGYRAMRTEVTQRVPQTQVQYQTSELIIGAIYQGYRITERPITQHERFAGETKKGHNLIYGWRYARVIIGTWRRERARAGREGRSLRPRGAM
jgi:glycosyltransferase involved in cell wall biosynthesis